jgi:Flp pilus assembly protein TadD
MDPEDPKAHYGLAVALLAKNENDSALDHALKSVGLLYHQPQAHYCLGIALLRLGMAKRALEAFETSVAMAPNQSDTHRQLAALYLAMKEDKARAEMHQRRAEELEARPESAKASRAWLEAQR